MNKWMRRIHRWASIAFTLTVIANFVVMGVQGFDRQPDVITYSPLPLLAVQLVTGLYLFLLPYTKRRLS